jgi:hypothetical protein
MVYNPLNYQFDEVLNSYSQIANEVKGKTQTAERNTGQHQGRKGKKERAGRERKDERAANLQRTKCTNGKERCEM